MPTDVCRSVISRNSSFISPSNYSNINSAEMITNGISLCIFLTAFIGNTAALIVIFTPRDRTRLTNTTYLANLAMADLFRTCFIPFTVIARIKRNFIFGRSLCKILPIVQGLGVSVGVFTLVCISIERYLAICHPFVLLKLQSLEYASLFNVFILITIWIAGFLTAWPNIYMYDLCFLPTLKRYKCEKGALKFLDERVYMIMLDGLYFVIPMILMTYLYTLIILRMSKRTAAIMARSLQSSTGSLTPSNYNLSPMIRSKVINHTSQLNNRNLFLCHSDELDSTGRVVSDTSPDGYLSSRHRFLIFRFSEIGDGHYTSVPAVSRLDRHRQKALKLIIVLILEFFICWTPLYLYHTIGTFDKTFYRSIPPVILDIILLFSFASASCNPITYYFMSERYRSILYANWTWFYRKKHRSMRSDRHFQTYTRSV